MLKLKKINYVLLIKYWLTDISRKYLFDSTTKVLVGMKLRLRYIYHCMELGDIFSPLVPQFQGYWRSDPQHENPRKEAAS